MIIVEMTHQECMALLARSRFMHLACARDGQPYVLPHHLVQFEEWLYGVSAKGKKIDWLRNGPRVCIVASEITDAERWASVVVDGRFEEIVDPNARTLAHRLIERTPSWWEPAFSRKAPPAENPLEGTPIEPIYFRVSLDRISGRYTK